MKGKTILSLQKASAILFVIVIGVVSYQPVFGQELSGAQKEIWNLENTYFELWENGDRKGFADLYSKEAIIWGNQALWPKDKSIIEMGEPAGDGISWTLDSCELESLKIKIIGNIAISAFTAKLVRLGKPHQLRIIHVWLKQDTNWSIISLMHDLCSELPKCL